jgi:hypothetical protein
MLNLKKSSRLGRWMLASTVAITTFAVVTQATTTITVPNAVTLSYNLAATGISGAITPASSVPVLVMGVCTTSGDRGVGHVTLQRVPGNFLIWVGLESTAGAAITQGFSNGTGIHIVYLDFGHDVDIEVAANQSIRVHNSALAARAGTVRLIY